MDEAAKKRALRHIPYGLFIAGTAVGDKVNVSAVTWLMQTSFQPPLVALAVKAGTLTHDMVKESGRFAITVLGSEQKELAAQFFRHVEPTGDRFGDARFTLTGDGCPVLVDGLAWWQCRVVGAVEQGDHHVYIGQVVEAGVSREGDSLTLRETGYKYGG